MNNKKIAGILIFITALLVFGTSAYILIEKWSIPDALYMTVNVLTTIGIREPHPLSLGGIFFTIFFSLLSFFALAAVISILSSVIVENLIYGDRRRKRMLKKIMRMKNHIIVCGAGKIGKYVINTLLELKKTFVVIDSDEKLIKTLNDENPKVREILSIVGDATNEEILAQSAVENAYGLIACMPEDSQNLFIALTARKLNPDIHLSCYIADEMNFSKFKLVGVEELIPGDYVIGRRLAVSLLNKNIAVFLEQTNVIGENESFFVGDIVIDKRSKYINKTIKDAAIYKNTGLLIFAIRQWNAEHFTFNPNPDVPLQAGDTLITFGSQKDLERLGHYINS
ncbi:MAG: potassium channel protein [Brevinematales bacterium]|nr:potassium channel protein [Brevinematales bacterium]